MLISGVQLFVPLCILKMFVLKIPGFKKGGLAQLVERVLKNRVTRGSKPGAGTNTLLVPIVAGDTSRTVWVQVLTPLWAAVYLVGITTVGCCLSGRHWLTPSHRVETISGFIPVWGCTRWAVST